MAGTSPAMTVGGKRSLDGAERNPGLPRGVDAAPDFAALHPGYAKPKTWMAGTSPAMTVGYARLNFGVHGVSSIPAGWS